MESRILKSIFLERNFSVDGQLQITRNFGRELDVAKMSSDYPEENKRPTQSKMLSKSRVFLVRHRSTLGIGICHRHHRQTQRTEFIHSSNESS